MPKSPRDSQSDPMAREVDRLLARLADLGTQPGHDHRAPGRASAPDPVTQRGVRHMARPTDAPTRRDRVALWARVLLGIGLGAGMTQWPYPHGCGWPLLGYFGAVAMVVLTGAWIAFTSWKLRHGVAHLLALVLLFWGIVLAAEQVLPRIGYAAERATWHC